MRHSDIQTFRHSDIQTLRHSDIETFRPFRLKKESSSINNK